MNPQPTFSIQRWLPYLFVPGFWEGAQPFESVSRLLSLKHFQTETCSLPSTGSISPGNPSMLDDIAAIRSSVESVLSAEEEIILVLHSAGGFLGSNAMEGLSKKTRAESGLKGGVVGIVFLAAAVFPEGFEHGSLPFTEIQVCRLFLHLGRSNHPLRLFTKAGMTMLTSSQGGALLCLEPTKTFFNDLEPEVAEEWTKKLKSQPAYDWNGIVTYCGWRDVPSVYLVCERDQAIPQALQIQMAESARSKIENCDARHMVPLSMPGKVSAVIEAAVASF